MDMKGTKNSNGKKKDVKKVFPDALKYSRVRSISDGVLKLSHEDLKISDLETKDRALNCLQKIEVHVRSLMADATGGMIE